MKKFATSTLLLLFSFWGFAQAPPEYYTTANGKKEYALKTALFNIIKSGQIQNSYNDLWTYFRITDAKQNDTVWDMYSDNPNGKAAYYYTYPIQQDHGTGGTAEGQYYNREHSFPQSWFKDALPMQADLFHIYPTDKKVNNQRGNYPYGKVGSASWTSTNGSKYGNGSSSSGYSGTVFEPIDAYKGDFARSYFYMATRYQDLIKNWTTNGNAGDILAGNDSSVYKEWTINLLLEWHHSDPVSQKEIDRNNAVYGIQKNRNPFIDYPELVDLIWGDDFGQPFSTNEIYPEIVGSTIAYVNSQTVYKTDKGKTNYVWTVNSNAAIIGSANLDSVVIAWNIVGEGSISVKYKDGDKQSETSNLGVTVYEENTGIASGTHFEKTISVYPNPVKTSLTIAFAEPFVGSCSIYNMLGEVIFSFPQNTYKQIQLNLQNSPNGMYFLQLNPVGCEPVYKKILIAH